MKGENLSESLAVAWTGEHESLFEERLFGSGKRKFEDGTAGGLRIRDCWPEDFRPKGGEQTATFYAGDADAFASLADFSAVVAVLEAEDSPEASARESYLASLVPEELRPGSFRSFWNECADLASAPRDIEVIPVSGWSLVDRWNEKIYVAVGEKGYLAVSWGTSA